MFLHIANLGARKYEQSVGITGNTPEASTSLGGRTNHLCGHHQHMIAKLLKPTVLLEGPNSATNAFINGGWDFSDALPAAKTQSVD